MPKKRVFNSNSIRGKCSNILPSIHRQLSWVWISNAPRRKAQNHITIDSIKEFRELTEIKLKSKSSGLFMIGGGVPKNFIQDTVICAELLGKNVEMHKYAIQITVADSKRDGACSSSTLKEASSWGKVDVKEEQMVFAEATSVLPLIASDAYHTGNWKNRKKRIFKISLMSNIKIAIIQMRMVSSRVKNLNNAINKIRKAHQRVQK